MTPVPGAAGLSITRAEPNTAMTSCGIVLPMVGTRTKFFLASSDPLRIASTTSPALPSPTPTTPLPSPTTTSTANENLLPPLTTLDTRLTLTT